MNTYFLKFPNESIAKTALSAAGIYVEPIGDNEGYYRQADINWAFDPIGIIMSSGAYDQVTGEELIPPIILDGWYANYIGGSLPISLMDYNLNPKPSTPYRIFAK
jgi:hypothetical protein